MRTKNRGIPFADEERPAAAQRAEMILADETEPEKAPEEKTKENKAEKHKESADEGKGKRKNILRCGSSCGLLSIMDWWKILLRLSQRFWRTACRENGILRRAWYGGSAADRPACGDGKGISSGSYEKYSVEIYRAIV